MNPSSSNRRDWLRRAACGFGNVALLSLLAEKGQAAPAGRYLGVHEDGRLTSVPVRQTQENCKLKVAEVVRLRWLAETPRILTNSATGRQLPPILQFSCRQTGPT